MAKVRVWSLEQIRSSFEEYLQEYNCVQSDRWFWLTVDERQALCDFHFAILRRDLERWIPAVYVKEEKC